MAPDTRKPTMDSLEEQIRVLTQQMEAMVKRQDDTQAVMTERPPELENHQTNHQPQADSKSTSEIGNNNTFFKFLSSTPKLELECPKFDGTNPRNWIQKCGRYMELLKHPDYQRVDIASLYMVGKADEWMRSYLSIRRGVCWNEFVMDLLGKFGDEGVDVCETNGKLEVASESAMKPDIEENSVSGDNILSSVVVSEVANDVLKVAIEPGKGRNPQLETEKVPTTIAPELFDESFKKEKLIVEAYELSKVQISKESIEPMVHLLNSDILLEVTKFDSSHDWGEDYQEQQGLEWRKDQAMKPGTFVSPPAVDIAKNLDSPSNSASLNISTKSMVPPSIVANGGNVSTVNSPVTSRVSTVYSEVQNRRLDHTLPLPSVIKNSFSIIDGPASSVVGNPDEIVELFPCLFGQPSAVLVPGNGKGRAASHITLECALQTHPNITLIGEVVACKKETLKNVNVTDYITDVVCKQAESGANYAVILIPDGLIGFTPEVPHLIEDTEPVKPEGWLDDGPAEIEVPEALEFTRKFMHKLVRIRVQRDELIFEGIKQFYVNADKEEWKREVDWFTFGAFPRVKLKFNIQKWWLSITRLEGKAMLWYHFIKYY